MSQAAPFDEQLAHRWFAMKLNNEAWDLLERADLSAVQQGQVVHIAHASCYHWIQVGNIVNHCRALCLIANAEAAYGDANSALQYAASCLDAVYAQSLDHDAAKPSDWDYAFAHDASARAHAAAWRERMAAGIVFEDTTQRLLGEAREQRNKARALGELINDQQEREQFLNWHSIGRWHGLD
jgi:hypothetical protein